MEQEREFLKEIKAGDYVWVRHYGSVNDWREPRKVAKLTRTQIVAGGNYYRRDNGDAVGKFRREHLVGIVTNEDMRQWEAEQNRKRAERETRDSATRAAEAKRAELRELYAPDGRTNNVYVRDAEYGSASERDGKFDVTFHGLTELQVRELAKRLKPE